MNRRKCSICGRTLGRKADPLSENCGGDCLGCMIDEEATESGSYTPHEIKMRDRIVELETVLHSSIILTKGRLRKLKQDVDKVNGPEHNSYYEVLDLLTEFYKELEVQVGETNQSRRNRN